MTPPHLTPREHEIVALIAKGKRNKEIASALGLTEDTVKEYVTRIMRKLGAVNRTDVAVREFHRSREEKEA